MFLEMLVSNFWILLRVNNSYFLFKWFSFCLDFFRLLVYFVRFRISFIVFVLYRRFGTVYVIRA